MSKVEKHPTDEGKYQSTFDDYGHGKGNGKSRNAIYKHAKKLDFVKKEEKKQARSTSKIFSDDLTQKDDNFTGSQSSVFENGENNGEKVLDELNSQNRDKPNSPIEREWGSVSWDDDEGDEIKPRTIPSPISDMAQGHAQEVSVQAQGQMIRFGFTALDRMVTHWGRGVMSKPDYTLERHPSDLDALEASTLALMAHYGIQVPISPLMVWSATVGSAYIPPIMHIKKNADPNRRKRGLGFLSKLNPFKRRKKKKEETPNQEVPQVENEGENLG